MRAPFLLVVALASIWACSSDDGAAGPTGEPTTPVSEAGSDDPLATLPDPLRFEDGRRVTTKEEWPARRAEIFELFAKNVYGRPPPKPDAVSFTVVEESATA